MLKRLCKTWNKKNWIKLIRRQINFLEILLIKIEMMSKLLLARFWYDRNETQLTMILIKNNVIIKIWNWWNEIIFLHVLSSTLHIEILHIWKNQWRWGFPLLYEIDNEFNLRHSNKSYKNFKLNCKFDNWLMENVGNWFQLLNINMACHYIPFKVIHLLFHGGTNFHNNQIHFIFNPEWIPHSELEVESQFPVLSVIYSTLRFTNSIKDGHRWMSLIPYSTVERVLYSQFYYRTLSAMKKKTQQLNLNHSVFSKESNVLWRKHTFQ